MTITKKIFIFLGFSVFCWVLVSCWALVSGRLGSSVDPIYYDIYEVSAANPDYVYDAEALDVNLPSPLWGVIMPSPADDSKSVARTMNYLEDNWFSSLILVVTFADDLDHEIVTSKQEWQTPFGVQRVNTFAVDHIEKCGGVVDDKDLEKARDLFDLGPYFGYYLPGAQIAPVAFDTSVSTTRLVQFMNMLAECNDGYKVLMVTPSVKSSPALFTANTETLRDLFDEAAVTNYSGLLNDAEAAYVTTMKYILRNGGSHASAVILDETATEPTFKDLVILYDEGA